MLRRLKFKLPDWTILLIPVVALAIVNIERVPAQAQDNMRTGMVDGIILSDDEYVQLINEHHPGDQGQSLWLINDAGNAFIMTWDPKTGVWTIAFGQKGTQKILLLSTGTRSLVKQGTANQLLGIE